MATKPDAPCLSQLGLARLASKQREPLPEEARHLETCPFCRAQLAQETELAYAASQEPVPAAIAALTQTGRAPQRSVASRFAHWQHGAVAAMVIVVVALTAQQLVRAPEVGAGPIERAKGSVQVSGAVKDAHQVVRGLDDLDHLNTLQAGDTLQIHVQAFDQADVTLVDADDHTVYYTGDIPAGGWLPVGLEVTPEGPLHLSLKVCAHATGAPCQTWELR